MPVGMSLLCIQQLQLTRRHSPQDMSIRPPKPSIDGGSARAMADAGSLASRVLACVKACLHNCRWACVFLKADGAWE
jgi:hypothetical protein